ncbi:MAG: SPOR domain-containing protein [Bacteroidales bacterium]
MRGFVFMCLILIGYTMQSQGVQEGKLTVIQDARVDSLMKKFIEVNAAYPQLKGWRVEIFFESGNFSKRLAMEARAAFIEKYTDIPSYVIFQQPYYKVRVGDFHSKMEAEKLLRAIERDYPNAFVVFDEINFPRLN